ncbi:hypothetical protein NDR87_33585 [Nocardia sp. CDC159]|uniref:DUF6545 domain-containing protein n=1 Tax=Nocardia pulmonis TaxID=2951408 RepID=A0A9X2EDH9_9NOCA|nr:MULTISPECIES: MAB_1171c family putative transporter [Nocardia]MCM6778429.1 hypothetical protein [Nocardia pulmonis]MCM6791318.1 hypothetical protein [Nocardia sp. CDC159]
MADHLGVILSVALLWATLILRAPFVWRDRFARILWIALASVAFATTLYLPWVIHALAPLLSSERAVDLTRHASQMATYVTIAVLFSFAARFGRIHLIYLTFTAATVCAMAAILSTGPPHDRVVSTAPGVPIEYWIALFGHHIVSDIGIIAVTIILASRVKRTETRWTLILFATARIVAVVLWSILLAGNITHQRSILEWVPPVLGLKEVLLAASVALPGITAITRWVVDQRRLHRISGLWSELTTQFPNVVLHVPAAVEPRLLPRHREELDWITYRKVIEINDAITELAPYTREHTLEDADRFLIARRVPARRRQPAAAACWLAAAAHAHRHNHPPDANIRVPPMPFDDNAFLAQTAAWYHTPMVADFVDTSLEQRENRRNQIQPHASETGPDRRGILERWTRKEGFDRRADRI